MGVRAASAGKLAGADALWTAAAAGVAVVLLPAAEDAEGVAEDALEDAVEDDDGGGRADVGGRAFAVLLAPACCGARFGVLRPGDDAAAADAATALLIVRKNATGKKTCTQTTVRRKKTSEVARPRSSSSSCLSSSSSLPSFWSSSFNSTYYCCCCVLSYKLLRYSRNDAIYKYSTLFIS